MKYMKYMKYMKSKVDSDICVELYLFCPLSRTIFASQLCLEQP